VTSGHSGISPPFILVHFLYFLTNTRKEISKICKFGARLISKDSVNKNAKACFVIL
jgi:hypothetical protein